MPLCAEDYHLSGSKLCYYEVILLILSEESSKDKTKVIYYISSLYLYIIVYSKYLHKFLVFVGDIGISSKDFRKNIGSKDTSP